MQQWWSTLPTRARLSLAAAAALVLVAVAATGWWLLRADRAVLFSDLRAQDAATVVAELEKLKVPFALADQGSTILVERSDVHALRLKLMGRELPLHGTVGLELFNTSDLGMTEFAQKINYQRALQGELTRTILSFPEVRDARVHLAFAEQGLFKQNAARAKAAITLNLRQGASLRAEQVSGIQRLVAAAVPGLLPQEVTIVDQQGVALSRVAEAENDASAGSARLDLKRETEGYLSRKAAAVLEKAFGPGQALASVDVTLNMDQVRVTTEDVIPAADGKGAAGVLVRERESARDSAAPEARAGDARGARGSSMQRDVEYQVGRRVEQVVSQPGAIRKIHVVAVVRQDLDATVREQVQRLLAAAVGASPERGDAVVLQVLKPPAPTLPEPVVQPAPAATGPRGEQGVAWWVLAGALLLAALNLGFARRLRARAAAPVLSDAQRRATLLQVQAWMLEGQPPAVERARTSGRTS